MWIKASKEILNLSNNLFVKKTILPWLSSELQSTSDHLLRGLFLLPAVNSALMEKRKKGSCPLWKTCVLRLDGSQNRQYTNFLTLQDFGMAALLQGIEWWTINFVRSNFVVICLHTHPTLNKCKLVREVPVWFLDLVSVRKYGHRERQLQQLKASLQWENLVIYTREKRSGLVMIPPEIKSIFLHYVWLTVNRGC